MNMFSSEQNAIELPPLALSGQCAYVVDGSRVLLTIEQIANNRTADNLSGTLAIELWALEQPYTGELFTGMPLAATTIGEVRGAHALNHCRYDLIFTAPTEGRWYVTLMLREWEDGAFITRDWRTLEMPAVVAEETPVVVAEEITAAVEPVAPVEKKARGISVNDATVEELAAIKGLSKKVAKAIVENRPYTALKELLDVKGIGEKMLKKLRDELYV